MGRKSGVPEGDAFLPGTTAAELKRLARREMDGKSSRKYLAAMHRKMGRSNLEIAEYVGENYEVVRVWLAEIHKEGISAIPRRKSPGPPRKMSLKTRQKIMVAVHKGPQAVGYKANYWTFKSLYQYAKEKLDVDLTYTGAVRAFREMGLRNKIPRPEHPLAASPEERIAYQRKTKKELEASGRDGFKIVFEDEGHVQALKNGHAMTSFKGVQPTRRSSVGRARLTLFVVVGEGFLFIKEGDSGNTKNYLAARERVCELFGKVHMIDDGAGYHESNRSKADASKNAGRLRRTKTLPYTPNDNSAEPQVRAIKSALSNVPLDSVGAIRSELRWCINTGQIKPVPLEKYARVDAPRITARRARAIKKRLEDDEHFVYDKSVLPAERGGVKLPTYAELKKKQEKILPPEKREKIPAILANSGIPDKVLANLPDVLLYESPNKVRLARQFGCAGRATAKQSRTRSPVPRRVTKTRK